MMKFYDKDKRKTDITALANALSKRDTTPINIGGVAPVQVKQDSKDVFSGANDLLGGGMKLYNGLQDSGLFGGNKANTDGLTLGNYFGSGSSGSMTFDSLGSSGGGLNGMPLIGNAIGGINGLAQSGDYKDGIQGIFGTGSDDSDVMQGIKGTANGALTGLGVGGPVGALVGGILGLGSSFLDDF